MTPRFAQMSAGQLQEFTRNSQADPTFRQLAAHRYAMTNLRNNLRAQLATLRRETVAPAPPSFMTAAEWEATLRQNREAIRESTERPNLRRSLARFRESAREFQQMRRELLS